MFPSQEDTIVWAPRFLKKAAVSAHMNAEVGVLRMRCPSRLGAEGQVYDYSCYVKYDAHPGGGSSNVLEAMIRRPRPSPRTESPISSFRQEQAGLSGCSKKA